MLALLHRDTETHALHTGDFSTKPISVFFGQSINGLKSHWSLSNQSSLGENLDFVLKPIFVAELICLILKLYSGESREKVVVLDADLAGGGAVETVLQTLHLLDLIIFVHDIEVELV